jgi:hypothetical protein
MRRGGIIQFAIGGVLREAVGAFTYNLGNPQREALVGSSGVDGFKETPQAAFIEGEVRTSPDWSIDEMTQMTNETITLTLAEGKVIALSGAWYAGEGTGNSEEGTMGVRFESRQKGVEVTS